MNIPSFGIAAAIFLAVAASAAPERGFTSKAPAAKWEDALVSGNGIHGAMVFGVPQDETVIINHGRLYMPLHKPLPPPETATILPDIRRHMANGEFQKAADIVVELANKHGYKGKHWTDPFIPACDLRIRMEHQGAMRNYERAVDFATGVASVAWDDDRGRFTRSLFVSRADDVIVMSIRGPKPGSVDCELTLDTRPDGNSRHFKQGIRDIVRKAAGDLLNYRMGFTNAYDGGIQACEVTAKVITKGGKSEVGDASIVVAGADEVLVLIRVGLPKNPGESTAASTAAALAELPADFDQLLAPHAKQHGEIFLRSKLELQGGHGRDLPSEDLIASSKVAATNPALLEKIYDAARYNIL
ncbi:MAG: glycoside hydrolase family 95 protein, partial [Verrucomicrobiae bacterium]|nr:glycoside hydrolase family 95 protein [Verrucomicrobiae bacterium]